MLKRSLFLVVIALFLCSIPFIHAQQRKTPGQGFVGSWRLRKTERIDGSAPVSLSNPQGLIIFDSAGHVAEIITRGNRKTYAIPNRPTPEEALEAFNTFAGFWGSYRVDEKTRVITYRPEGAVNPSQMGQDIKRGYELSGDQFVVTSEAGESNTEGIMRWTWQRVPDIENLSPEYRKMVGFWLWVGDKVINPADGSTISVSKRDPSIIVYAPSGYISVLWPPSNRKPLAGHMATGEEAKADMAGYIGYIAVLTLHPGWVVHHQVFAIAPGVNGSLDRAYEVVGDEVHLSFPPTPAQGGGMRQALVTLRRLSGAQEMIGK